MIRCQSQLDSPTGRKVDRAMNCETCKKEFRPDGEDGVLLALSGDVSYLAPGAQVICEACFNDRILGMARNVVDADSLHEAVNVIFTAADEGYITSARSEILMAAAARSLVNERDADLSPSERVAETLNYLEDHSTSEDYKFAMRSVSNWALESIARFDEKVPLCENCGIEHGDLSPRKDWSFGRVALICGECAPPPGDDLEGAEASDIRQVPFQVGDRVRLVRCVERYPHASVPAGSLGTVKAFTDPSDPLRQIFEVKLDKYYDGLDDWDNCLQWHQWDAGTVDHPADDLEKRPWLES